MAARLGHFTRTCAQLSRCSVCRMLNKTRPAASSHFYSTEPLEAPASGNLTFPKHVEDIVDSIEKLNLLEVSSLNKLLKERLGISDIPMMSSAGPAAAAPVEEEEQAPVEAQTEFGVKLIKFDDSKKVKLIKEIKTILTDVNLVQAKKFVESAPQVVKEKLSKEDAEKLKAQLEGVGASVEIE
ncbi:large ribosomal subunit protein bL12-like [Clytia hemisphaerica]|uniref:39S ribosomal protein L12, mitochondrial n=1 Tax=Clytia hemisphaerica TaxID=252671 RepID=A0A7M5WT29_9CNID